MMEGGLYKFYGSLGAHLAELREHQQFDDYFDEDDPVPPVSIQQIQFMLMLALIPMMIGWVFLLVEYIVFRYRSLKRCAMLQARFMQPGSSIELRESISEDPQIG